MMQWKVSFKEYFNRYNELVSVIQKDQQYDVKDEVRSECGRLGGLPYMQRGGLIDRPPACTSDVFPTWCDLYTGVLLLNIVC